MGPKKREMESLKKWGKEKAVKPQEAPRRKIYEPVVPREASRRKPLPSGSGRGIAPLPEASNPREEPVATAGSVQIERCAHYSRIERQADLILRNISKQTLRCEVCRDKGQQAGLSTILACLYCGRILGTKCGHAQQHAKKELHWLAAWCSEPYATLCFKCDKEDAAAAFAVKGDAGGQASGSAIGYGNPVRGIPNRGGTCYVNALVQCLLALKEMRVRMLGPSAPTSPVGSALKDLFEVANGAGGELTPDTLLASIQSVYPQFKGYQDSHELLCCLRANDLQDELIDSIFGGQLYVTKECSCCLSNLSVANDAFLDLSVPLESKVHTAKCVSSPPSKRSRGSELNTGHNLIPANEDSIVGKIQTTAEGCDLQIRGSELKLVMEKAPETSEADCAEADQVRQSRDINTLSSIDNCLKMLFTATMLEQRCGKCSKGAEQPNTNATTDKNTTIDLTRNEQRGRNGGVIQKSVIRKLPPVLTIHVKRYSSGNTLHKVRKHVSFNEILDVGQFMDPSSEDKDHSRYRLVGVIEHRSSSTSMEEGHYVAYVRGNSIGSHQQQHRAPSSWFCANDSIVEEVSLEEVRRCEVYMLFYERTKG